MHISNILFAAAAVASAVSAAVIPETAPTAFTTTMFRKESNLTPIQKAVKSLNRLHKKAGSKATFHTSSLSNPSAELASSSSSFSAPLSNEQDFVYFVPCSFGNGQTFNMDLDTGSSDTWVRGTSCTSKDTSCDGPKLDTSDSSITSTGASFSTSYGSGSVSGKIYKGPVSIGGAVSKLNFGVSTSETGFVGNDGLVGLGFASISNIANQVSGQTNFVDGLGFSGSQNQFGFYFSNSVDGDQGEVTFGGYDSNKIAGPITYVPLNSQTYWQFSSSGISYSAGTKSGTFSVSNSIADTGTTLIILDTAAANNINKAIGASAYNATEGVYRINCASTGPDVTFKIGSGTFSLPPSAYIIGDGEGGCFSGITQGASGLGGVAIFGDIFLRRYYSIYDKTNSRVGFALAKHPNTPAPTSSTASPSTTAAPTTTSKTTVTPVPTTTQPTSSCAHSICVQGAALKSSCSPCVAKIIAQDDYCGSNRWDSQCVSEVGSICGITC
ncbi:Vacuolar protease A [Phlyctochytrium planicorne]|nr:Vacuolar protease A [Phlyctochytrium planicorne]